MLHRTAANSGEGLGVPAPALVRRLGEAGCAPGDGRVGALDLLARSGLPVPEGFVLTTEAHREFLRTRGLWAEILSPTRGHGHRSLGEVLEGEIRPPSWISARPRSSLARGTACGAVLAPSRPSSRRCGRPGLRQRPWNARSRPPKTSRPGRSWSSARRARSTRGGRPPPTSRPRRRDGEVFRSTTSSRQRAGGSRASPASPRGPARFSTAPPGSAGVSKTGGGF